MEIQPKKLIVGFVLIFLLGVMFSVVNGSYAEETSEPLPLITYGISFVSLIVGGLIVLLLESRINKIQLQRVLKVLPKEEEKIISLLLQNQNAMEQNKLVAYTGINKVKMSRIIGNLESRGVIKKTNLGNTNLIVLKI